MIRRYPRHALSWTDPKVDLETRGEPQTQGYRLPNDQRASLETNAVSWAERRADGTQVVFTEWPDQARFAVWIDGEEESHWGTVESNHELWCTDLGGRLDTQGNPCWADHIRALEEKLLEPATRRDASLLREIFVEELVEFTRAGVVFDRERLIQAFAAETTTEPSRIVELNAQRLSPRHAHITFKTQHGRDPNAAREVLRSSLWRLDNRRWRLEFHQATAVPPKR
ncbi:MAG: nuclear transport factor 2 family protein [Polyangiaceae bacterium]